MLIEPKNFISDHPDLHPLSNDYITYWREQKRRSIEGYWVGGYYMPPSLYFYVNMGMIERNVGLSNNKTIARPSLHDIEWEFFRNWTEALGFSGFELDEDYSSNKLLLEDYSDEELFALSPSCFNSSHQRKTFISPREALRIQHPYNKGRALYENEVYNFMMLGSRDSGKSYSVGLGIVLHQFLTDGLKVYNDDVIKNPPKVEVAVGAESSSRSALMLSKVRLAMDLLPGSKQIGTKFYPSPFSKQYKGSWGIGKDVVAEYEKKLDGGWVTAGSRSSIKHRTFKDNPFAVQGGREVAIVLEEAGLMSNLKEVFANTKDNLRSGLRKTGSLVMLGTGGDMDKGTLDAYEMFYNPETYDILPFEDLWENRGKIGYFLPAYMVLRNLKDEYGNSKVEVATKELQKKRETAKMSKGGSFALTKEMQYRPLVPSEMFLTRASNIFPIPELRRRHTELTTLMDTSSNVTLFFDHTSPNGINYEVDLDAIRIDTYPWSDDKPKEGAIAIYEFPYMENGKVPEGAYIIGCDPFKDDTETGSFASIFVMKTNRYPSTVGYEQIVASYIGRPYGGKAQVNEILYKLSLFYGNAKIYFENAVGNVKDYFEKIRRLDLLALQPTTVFNKKASFNTATPMIYGYPMSNQKVKWEAIQYVRQHLLQLRSQDETSMVRNLDLIPDKFLLEQLISFNLEGNFDAVMGYVGCVIGLEEIYNLSKRREFMEHAQSSIDKEWDLKIFKNKKLFNEKFSKAASFF